MKQTQTWTKWVFFAGVLALAAVLALWLWPREKEPAQGPEREIAVVVTHSDKIERKVFLVKTRMENLGDALVEQELVQGEKGTYGLYITTVDGETADAGKQEWWCITKNGESLMTAADLTPISDGDQFELTFTIGF